jgi:uncharacterized membrane protein YbhN (UPF0104 family)
VKKAILSVIQILVTVGLLWWVFRDPQKRADTLNSLAGLKTGGQLAWIIGGILAYGVVEVLAVVRWQILLRVQKVRISTLRLGGLVLIGLLFNPFLPGGTAGDAVKIYYLLKETPGKRTQALLAALIDRMIGLIGLIFVAGVLITWRWSWLTQGMPLPYFELKWLVSPWAMKEWLMQIPGTTQLLYVLLAVLGASILGVATSFVITGFGLVHKLPLRFPKRDIFVDLSIAYNAYARAWKTSLAAFVLSLGVHVCSFTVFFCAAKALLAPVRYLDFCSVMPIVNTLTALPISVGGTGPREGMFQTLLSELCGLSKGQAVAISLTGFVLVVFWSVVGGVVYAIYRPSEHTKLKEVKRQIQELEHEVAEKEDAETVKDEA